VSSDLTGTSLGGYRLVGRVASGGSGDVWMAHAEHDREDRVAIKVAFAATAAARRHFVREQHALERLDHPGIARSRGSGTLASGQPFLVTAFVGGEHLDDHGPGLETPQLLVLVERLAATLQHAHAHGVAHGDVKPANVLVTAAGAPVLLDFGEACLEASGGAPTAPRTTTGPAPLTPYYASPERLAGAAASARSDVFALGIVLRDLLVDAGDAAAMPTTLRRCCARVVARCLDPDPAERYADAGALARDLEHVRCGRRPTRKAPWARIWRRHRRALAAVAVGVSLLAGAAALAIDGEHRARSSRREALSVSEFLVRLLDQAAPEALGPAVTLPDAWETAEAMIPTTFATQPEGEARVRMAYGRAYAKIGEPASAAPHLERAITLLALQPETNRRSIEWCQRLLAQCRGQHPQPPHRTMPSRNGTR
jgi:eukaryotic-like serine/threonine-protein kinase